MSSGYACEQRRQLPAVGDGGERLVARDARALHHFELQPRGDLVERVEVGGGERLARHQDRADAVGRVLGRRRPGPHDDEVIARALHAPLLQRRRRQHGTSIDLARAVRVVPPRDRQHAARRQPVQEVRPGLERVERVLRQHERAARGCRPGVDQRDLDDVDRVAHPRQVAARLVVDEAHARIAIEVAGEVAEPAVDELEDARVDLDAGNGALAEHQRREDVSSAAGTDDDDAGGRAEVMSDVGDVVLEVLNGGGIAVERRQLGAGIRIDVEVQLARGELRRQCGAESPSRRPHRLRRIADHANPREGVPALDDRPRLVVALDPHEPQPRVIAPRGDGVADGGQDEEDGDGCSQHCKAPRIVFRLKPEATELGLCVASGFSRKAVAGLREHHRPERGNRRRRQDRRRAIRDPRAAARAARIPARRRRDRRRRAR